MPGGRSPKFKPEYTEQVEKLCHLGATDEQLALFFNVTEQTINNWKTVFPEFFESIKKGKQEFDARVADSLAHRALGYSCPETKAQWVKDYEFDADLGRVVETGGHWETLDMIKHYPPSEMAGMYWLNNRQRGAFKQRQDVEVSGTVVHEHIAIDEARREVKERLAGLLDGPADNGAASGNGKH